jgi:hypothetical protein
MSSVQVSPKFADLIHFRRDFLYYAPRCLWVRPREGPLRAFHPNKAQLYIHNKIEAQYSDKGWVRALVLKGRQQGVSTYTEGRFYWRVSGEMGKKAFILTHEDKATNNIFEMVERFHNHCPHELRPATKKANAKELSFRDLDSGYLVATAGAKDTGRSATAQFFHGSEVAYWAQARDHMAALGQIVPNIPGTEIILESTGNGMDNEFYYIWEDAIRSKGDYIAVFVPWFWDPDYRRPIPEDWAPTPEEIDYLDNYAHRGCTMEHLVWRRAKIDGPDFRGDINFFDQEYPATPEIAFMRVTGQTLIPAKLINRAVIPKGELIENRGPKIMGLDPSDGVEDEAALAFRQGRRVPRVAGRHGLNTMELVGWVALEADRWEPDAINVDATGIGSGVADRLRERGYPVNRVMVGERAVDEHIYMRVCDEMIGRFREWLSDEPCEIPDDPILRSETISRTFSYDSSSRIVLTPKKTMRSKGIKSPNRLDAVGLTFAINISPNLKSGAIKHDRITNPRVL